MASKKKYVPKKDVPESKRTSRKFTELDPRKHGVGGLLIGGVKPRKQDRRALAGEGYAVVFFPKYTKLGKAHLHFFGIDRSFSRSPEAAISKFMDGIARSETWKQMARAGHRVRKVKIIDLGDA